MEPNLNKSCRGAVHIPGEIVLDPWVYSISLAAHARENGAEIFTNFSVDSMSFDGKVWTICRRVQGNSRLNDSLFFLKAKAVVNAAGLWADVIQAKVFGKSSWTARPRRGQNRVYTCSKGKRITHPIQPIPSQRTKGIFVFSTLYDQIVVGPTALDQKSKTDRVIDANIARKLDAHVRRILPWLNPDDHHIGDYVGIRPGTDKRDYQIHLFPNNNLVACAGIRSTGLTASLGIGNYVVRNLQSILGVPEPLKATKTTPMPSLYDLRRDYHAYRGFVRIKGHFYKVTHPITQLGWTCKKDSFAKVKSKL